AGDDVALEAHLLLGEEPAVLDHAAVEHIRHVLVRQNGEHTRECARLRGVDPRDACMGVVGVAELRDCLTGQGEIRRVAAEAWHLLLAVRTNERRRHLDRSHPCAPLAVAVARIQSGVNRPRATSAGYPRLTSATPATTTAAPRRCSGSTFSFRKGAAAAVAIT